MSEYKITKDIDRHASDSASSTTMTVSEYATEADGQKLVLIRRSKPRDLQMAFRNGSNCLQCPN